ncbi:MAG: TonB-dependent receptor [Rikenellaceae bacterium]|nr:TonB-dependent receptor [Rikenellaceae bacterium]
MIRKIVLSLVAILSCGAMAMAQNKQVTGTVTDPEGAAMAGVTVQVEGTMNATATNAAGQYSISAPAEANLVFSYIGMASQTQPVGQRSVIDVTMQSDSQVMEDVVVTAFGATKREAFTGSAAEVKAEDISKVQTSNVAQSLAGKVAGLQLVNASGKPGSAPSIRIRGFSSINASQEPLYVVDGIPYDGDLNNINPADIESMTVQKDATSTSLYGARGANGVVMITTKRSKSRDAIVNVDAKWGVTSKALKNYDYITNPAEYYEVYYSALNNYLMNAQGLDAIAANAKANQMITATSTNGGLAYQIYNVPAGQYFIGLDGKVNPRATMGNVVNYKGEDYLLTADNWDEEGYSAGFRQEYNASVAGSTDRMSMYASFGYLKDEGIVSNTDMYRYTARLRADYQAKKWLSIGGNASFSNYEWNQLSDEGASNSTGNVFAFTSNIAPIYPVYLRNPDGSKKIDSNGHVMYDYGDGMNAGLSRPYLSQGNALSQVLLDKAYTEGNAFTGTAYAEATIIKGLKVRFNVGTGLDEYRGTDMANPYYGQFATQGGTLSKSHGRTFYLNTQELITYNTNFCQDHNLDVMVGHEYYYKKSYSLSAYKTNLFDVDYDELNGVIKDPGSSASGRSMYNTEGYFGRIQYDYDGRIFVNGSYRRDASSNFHPDYRWGNFWSAGAGWLINKERWFDVPWINMLKLKASVGSQGNDGIGSFLYTDRYSIVNDGAGNVSLNWTGYGNKEITWETNTNVNVGVDFGMFNGRLSGTVEYFTRKTTDMLYSFGVPGHLGFLSYYDNVGDMKNSGVELDLHGVLVNTKNVRWSVNANATHVKNKVLKIADENKSIGVQGHAGFESGNKFIGEGLSLYTFYLPMYAGTDKETGEPMWYKDEYEYDENGNVLRDETKSPIVKNRTVTKTYSEATDYLCGAAVPDLYGGFGTSIEFYGVDFGVNFTYQIGGLTYDGQYASQMSSPTSGSTGTNIHRDIYTAWSQKGEENNVPRWQYNDQYSASSSDRFLTSASYLNIQNAQLGYTIPAKLTKKFGVSMLRIYVAADNIWYWSKRQGLDPRQSFSGGSSAAYYAPVRTISGGINIQF